MISYNFIINYPGNNEAYSGTRGLNFAEPDAVSSDLRDQAEKLISKLKRSTNIDMDKDWKVSTDVEKIRFKF